VTESNDDLAEARALRLAIGRAARSIRRLFVKGGEGLAFLELGILDRLDRSGPTSPSSLSDNEGVTGPAIAETLRHLESLGLVERSRDPADGRRTIVTITEDGRRSLQERDASVLRRLRETLGDRLNPSEHATLTAAIPLLERIASEL
jgi:DNA-binding MarR family transcriptional regulator